MVFLRFSKRLLRGFDPAAGLFGLAKATNFAFDIGSSHKIMYFCSLIRLRQTLIWTKTSSTASSEK